MDTKNTVLIVDDDASNLMELSHILRGDYKIFAVKDGESAIEKAKESLPDLILLDVIMPGMSGFEAFEVLKKDTETAHIPVIFITGLNDSEHKGLSLGAVDYIRKPFDTQVVKVRVSNHIKIINLQQGLQASAAEAEAANRSKTAFLANMSHEIRTPMNAIMGITNILLGDKDLPADAADALNKIMISSEMLLEIIDDILDMTKIEAGKLHIRPEKYEVASMLNDAINLNMKRIREKPIQFELDIDENIPAQLKGDVTRIKQIINNLLSLAFKHTDSGSVKLTVTCETHENHARLVLRVSGSDVDITPEQLSIMLDDYSRFNPEREGAAIEELGLGLALTQKLAEMMGAELIIKSEQNKGPLFTVCLPQECIDGEVLGKEVADNLRNFHYTLAHVEDDGFIYTQMPDGRILIVDDVEVNLFVAAGVMEPYGLTIDMADSGQEAVEKIKAGEQYHVIFMDYMMPQMNGLQATQAIRGLGYTAPVVALTADTITSNIEMFLESGFDGLITKPINPTEVDKILKKYVR